MATSETRRETSGGRRFPGLEELSRAPVTRFVLILIGVAALTALLLSLLWYAAHILLLAFGGIILAVFLGGLAGWVSEHTRIRYGWALALVIIALLCLIGLVCWFLSASIMRQVNELVEEVPKAIDQLRAQLAQTDWGRQLVERLNRAGVQITTGGSVVHTATDVVSRTVDVVVQIILLLLVGVYGAATPDVYFNGIARLFPVAHRRRIRQALSASTYTLWWWTITRLISMAWVGVTTGLALWLLGVPLALTLGILTGLLKFVPYFGPIVALVPAVLLALVKSPMLAVWVVLVYFALEMIDDHVIMPLLNWDAIWLPPAVGVFAQVLLGALWGILGILFAMPLAACLLALVKLLYVEDALGDTTQVPGTGSGATGSDGSEN